MTMHSDDDEYGDSDGVDDGDDDDEPSAHDRHWNWSNSS